MAVITQTKIPFLANSLSWAWYLIMSNYIRGFLQKYWYIILALTVVAFLCYKHRQDEKARKEALLRAQNQPKNVNNIRNVPNQNGAIQYPR